ncbi:MAG: tRNA (guanine(46)-N(7))-methyltransferase TrmB [Thermoguttaceae bacterium]
MPQPGEIEYELGVAIPGAILSPDRWVKTALKKLPAEGPMDWEGLFGRKSPIVLDLGCGNGRFVLASALRRPEMDHLGLDILPLVIRYATRRGNQRGLGNVRFAVCGGHEFLERYTAPGTIQEIHVYHPQPYGDAQKKERRLVTPHFLALVYRALAADGLWVIQTDNRAYWRYIANVASRLFDFHPQESPWPDMPEGRTRREIMARRMGLPVFRGWGRPITGLDSERIRELVAELPLPTFDATIRQRPGKARRAGRKKGHRPGTGHGRG